MPVTYDEAIEWLLSFADFERSGRFRDRPDVAPMLSLLERLGNPHLGRATMHIAGSKGKGSVAAMVEHMIFGAGVCTGLYTSPHLYSYCERIVVDGRYITEVEFAGLSEQICRVAQDAKQAFAERHLVTFDLLTALAFLAFRDCPSHASPLEAQVIEVGLGGRVDSTNVFETKEVAVITPISLEHTAILGGTIEQIAREKAAIITRDCSIVMAPQPYEDSARVIREFADAKRAPVIDVRRDYKWERLSSDLRGQEIRIHSKHGAIEARLPLLGLHQIENATTALACVEALRSRDSVRLLHKSLGAIADSLKLISWPCRIEVLRERPLVIADGAHNRDSARRLRETLVDYFACGRALFIIGCSADKDIEGVAEELAPLASRVIAVRADHPRAMAPERIAEEFGRLNIDTEMAQDVATAVERAIATTGESGVICATGSLFVAAEARAHVLGVKSV